jgi:hypothetical protein
MACWVDKLAVLGSPRTRFRGPIPENSRRALGDVVAEAAQAYGTSGKAVAAPCALAKRRFLIWEALPGRRRKGAVSMGCVTIALPLVIVTPATGMRRLDRVELRNHIIQLVNGGRVNRV